MKRKYLTILLSVIVSFLFVMVYTFAATTISTNITTGGTLTVTGATTLNGNVTLTDAATDTVTITGDIIADTDTLYVDVSTDRVGIGTTTPAAMFSVGEGVGTVTGDVYMTGGLTLAATSSLNSVEGTLLFPDTRVADPTAVEGLVYYHATDKVLKMSDGTNWFTIGTSTSGLTLSDPRLQLASTRYYMAFGTTTQSGLSVMTLEATSTAAIPLTVRGYNGQTANLLQVHDVGSNSLFIIDADGDTGIGTSTPWATFSIDTNVGVSPFVVGSSTDTYFEIDKLGDVIFNAGNFTINEDSADKDFRVESNGQANMLYVDGTNDRVGIATATPWATLSVESQVGESAFTVGSSTNTYLEIDSNGDILMKDTTTKFGFGTSTPWATFSVSTQTGFSPFVVGSSTDTYFEIDELGNVVFDAGNFTINEDSADRDFRVESDGDANMLFVDGGNDRVGIATSTPGAMFSVGASQATSTIAIPNPCFEFTVMVGNATTTLYYYPCSGTAEGVGPGYCIGGWATSTVSCN